VEKSQKIEQELIDSKGFKKYFKGGFGKKAKLAEAAWRDADTKGVFAVTPVARSNDTGVDYIIYAFTNDGSELSDKVLNELSTRAATLTKEQMKAEDRGWLVGFEPLVPPAGHPVNKKGDAPLLVHHLADGLGNVRTFQHTILYFDANGRAAAEAAYVFYIKNSAGEFIKVLTKAKA
jgi:hypothetical protein